MSNDIISLTFALSLAITPSALIAEEIPVPSQEEWATAKKSVELSNGMTMAYSEMGNTEGDPLILIHGYSDNSRSWSLIAPYLTERHIYAVDLRGHGQTDAPACCYSLPELANDVHLFLEALAIENADIAGHSLGSITAHLLAAQYPEQVDDLILVSTLLEPKTKPDDWLWENVMSLVAPIDPEGEFMKAWYWNPNPVDETFLEYERKESAAMPIHAWRGVAWGFATGNVAIAPDLVKAPILILWGDQDQLMDKSAQDGLRGAYPDAEFEAFEGAGHNMFWEEPERAANLMLNFAND